MVKLFDCVNMWWLCIVLFSSAMKIFGARQFHLGIVSTWDRPEIRRIADFAVKDLIEETGLAITYQHYFAPRLVPSPVTLLAEQICKNAAGSLFPDLLIDLTLNQSFVCFLGQLARQLDCGIMTVDAPNCAPFPVEQSGFMETDVLTEAGIPSMRFPSLASLVALTSYTSVLHNVFHTGSMFVLGMRDNNGVLFPNSGRTQFIGRYAITVNRPLDMNHIVESFMPFKNMTQMESWAFWLSRGAMSEILFNTVKENLTWFEKKQLLVYDGTADPDRCWTMCYPNVDGRTRCGYGGENRNIYCVKVDMKDADLRALGRVRAEVGAVWDDVDTEQLDITYSYEAVKSSVYALMKIPPEDWPPPRERAAKYSTFCELQEPKLTVTTRFYKFVNAVTRLPVRTGTMGIIAFNGSSFNKNSKFRLHLCAMSSIASASYCEDTGSTYSYAYNALEMEVPLNPTVSPNRLRVAVINDPPFVVKTTDGWSGYSVQVFEYLAKTLDLEYEYVEQPNRVYGEMLSDGTWTGIIGQVSSKKVDIGLGPIVKSQERLSVVDFSIPYYESAGLVIVSKREKLNNLPADFFLDFLTPECWLCVFGIVFGFILIFWAMDVVSPYSWRYHPESKRPNGIAILNWWDSAWYVLGSCLQQGDSVDPGSISCKLAIGSMWLFIACMTFMISCNLSARLTVSGLSKGIETLDQLIRQTKIPYTIREQSVEFTFFRRMYEIEHTLFETWTNITESSDQWSGSFFVSRYPITERYGTCFLRMQRWGFAKDIHELLGLVQQNWIVFMESSLASYYVHTSCNMKIIGDRIGSWNYGIALPKNSALTSMIDKALLQLKGDSILEEIADRWWIKNNTNCMDLENTGLLLYELQGAFIIFATAIGTSSILFGIEVLVWRWQNKPKTAEPSSWLYLRFKEFSTKIINVTRFLSLQKKLGPPSIFVSEAADVEDTKAPTYEVVGDSET